MTTLTRPNFLFSSSEEKREFFKDLLKDIPSSEILWHMSQYRADIYALDWFCDDSLAYYLHNELEDEREAVTEEMLRGFKKYMDKQDIYSRANEEVADSAWHFINKVWNKK